MNKKEKKVGIASDHAGFALKQFVKQYLEEKGLPYKDYGTYTEESCDYKHGEGGPRGLLGKQWLHEGHAGGQTG